MKLAMLALLIHPIDDPGADRSVRCHRLGAEDATNNPGAHGFYEILYEFTSASANNGSGLWRLGDTFGFNDPATNPSPPASRPCHWDIATGLVMLIGRFIPIIAPIAFAGIWR